MFGEQRSIEDGLQVARVKGLTLGLLLLQSLISLKGSVHGMSFRHETVVPSPPGDGLHRAELLVDRAR
jgi:hypothetical protein